MPKNINQYEYKKNKFIEYFIRISNITTERKKITKIIGRLEPARIFLILILLNVNNFIGFWAINFRTIINNLIKITITRRLKLSLEILH